MRINPDPIVGNWYRHLDKGPLFMVVAFDDKERLIELQHFDADIEEVDMSTWFGMDLQNAEAPEDWTGPMDSLEKDDVDYDESPGVCETTGQRLLDSSLAPSESLYDCEMDGEILDVLEEQPLEEPW